MKWAAILPLFVYVGLKVAQLAFLGRASGYRGEPTSVGRRVKAGEPAILMLAALFTVPPALAATWYHTHKFNAVMQRSLDCYGLIAAYRTAPAVSRSNGDRAVYLAYEGYRATALDAGQQLGVTSTGVQRRLDRSASAFAGEQPGAGDRARWARIEATQRCLQPPRDPANE